jgi:polysaccharide biosynthesis/export protein
LKQKEGMSPKQSRAKVSLALTAIACLALLILAHGVFARNLQSATPATSTPDKPNDKPTNADPAAKAGATGTNPQVDPDAYRIGLSDQLMISVWKEPELSMTVEVRPDGMITLPLVNDIHVVGLKPVELQQILTDKLKPFLTEPQVTVIVQGIRSRKVYLVGNVSKQGAYPLEGGETVLQMLAASGGLGVFAKADSIYILRTENNKQVRIPFQYKKALKGKTKDDVVLEPGDVIVVP